MYNFIFKPNDYLAWADHAITKILYNIDQAQNKDQLLLAKHMVDNFVIINAVNVENDNLDHVHDLASFLWLAYKLQEQKIEQTVKQ